MGGVRLPDHDKPFRMPVREWAQEHRFDDAEDGRVCADASAAATEDHDADLSRCPVQQGQAALQNSRFIVVGERWLAEDFGGGILLSCQS